MADQLVFVKWCTRQAVYRNGALIYFGEVAGNWSFLKALGCECSHGGEVPTYDIPPEFFRDDRGWWAPPEKLADFARQMAAWKRRVRREDIASLRNRLAELEKEEARDQ